jgi:hypothetical protein
VGGLLPRVVGIILRLLPFSKPQVLGHGLGLAVYVYVDTVYLARSR